MTVYSVLTEFKFEAGQAIAESDALQNKLKQVSDAADAVKTGIQNAAMSMLGQIGLYGGISGAIYTAIKAADKYQQTQRSIANIFLSNGMFTGADQFEASMSASAAAMENIKKAAREFSLPVGDFAATTKLIGASLINHGLDDSSLSKSVMLSRGYLKSAPMLGIDPGLAQGELMDMVNGRAHMGARLTQRLVGETSAMREFGGGPAGGVGSRTNSGLAKFNALTPEKRLETLTKALMQFGSNSKIVEENAKSLSSQMQRLTDNVTGMFSVLRPLGDAILTPLKTLMLHLNQWLETSGELVVKKLATILKDIFENPEKLFADLMQLKHLKRDVSHAGEILAMSASIHGLTWALRSLGFELNGGLINTGLNMLWRGLKYLGEGFVSLGGLALVGRLLLYVFTEVLPPLILFTTILQGISRGIAQAEILNAKWLVSNMGALSQLLLDFRSAMSKIMAPITLAIEGIADMTSHLLSHNILWDLVLQSMGSFAHMLSFVGDVVVGILSGISASMRVLLTVFDAFTSHDLSKLLTIPEDFMEGWHTIWDRFHKQNPVDVDNSAVSKTTMHVDNVNINNQFKEQMEPDRIAFALKDQLLKAVTNRTQGDGNSMAARASR